MGKLVLIVLINSFSLLTFSQVQQETYSKRYLSEIKSSNLATIADIFDGSITIDIIRSQEKLKIIPDNNIDKVLNYTVVKYSKGNRYELIIESDSINKKVKEFILNENKLGIKLYIVDIIVQRKDKKIDTLNSISLILDSKIRKHNLVNEQVISCRASIGNIISGKIKIDELINQNILSINDKNFKISKFTCVIPDCGNFVLANQIEGNKIPDNLMNEIKKCKKGSIISFEDIQIIDSLNNKLKIPIITIRID